MKIRIPTSQILAFGGADLESWADPLFQTLPSGPAVLISFGAMAYGAHLVDRLRAAGLKRLERVGREARVLTACWRSEFNALSAVAELDGAGFVYFQGGNPRIIVETVANTLFWRELIGRRLSLVTTSGSAMALGERCPDISTGMTGWVDGLGIIPETLIAAHWDSFHAKDPSFRSAFEREAASRRLLTLDDEAALELDGGLRAHGVGAVQAREHEAWRKVI